MSQTASPSGPQTKMRIGLLRLTDSAPAIAAHEFGFFAEEGVDTEIVVEPSWANIADKLTYGALDAAIIVPPLAFAVELGLRGAARSLVIPCGISLGGNTVTLARDLALRVRAQAGLTSVGVPTALAAIAGERASPLMLGIVHAFSTHNLLLRYWLASGGLDLERQARFIVVPPSRAAEALALGQIDGFCAGAPWGDVAARASAGLHVATSDDIWRNAPEKAFAVRKDWADAHHSALGGAIRALARAGQFCDAPENASYTAALLSRQRYLNVDSHAILSSLPGGAVGQTNQSRFWRHTASFPWRSHAVWFLHQMARWNLIDGARGGQALAQRVYRPDLYRAALAPLGISIPLADSKEEGAHAGAWQLPALPAPIAMEPDGFCDGARFDAAKTALHNK